MRRFPWFEIVLIVGLAVALIVRPQTRQLSASTAAGVVVAEQSASRARTVVGEIVAVGDGTARSWVRLDDAGEPTAVGITLTAEALSALPDTDPAEASGQEFVLRLPPDVKLAPFDHLALNWNSRGHEPAGVYDKPHFDFHFFMMSPSDRRRVRAGSDAMRRLPETGRLPEDYQDARAGVDAVGLHWVDRKAPELNGRPFTATFLYGTYDGRVTFLEPMVSKTFLESHPEDLAAAIKLPKVLPGDRGYFPTSYRVHYDQVAREYTVALEGLARH
jgi:hypothetical protein